MNTIKVAIPTDSTFGLTSPRSDHFGHCKIFTVVEVKDGAVKDVSSLANQKHEAGGCVKVVDLLQENGISVVIAGGMGGGPFRALQNRGIRVLFADSAGFPDVQSAIDAMLEDKLSGMEIRQLCQGSGNCHQHGNIPA